VLEGLLKAEVEVHFEDFSVKEVGRLLLWMEREVRVRREVVGSGDKRWDGIVVTK
jgi:hypothetical protein